MKIRYLLALLLLPLATVMAQNGTGLPQIGVVRPLEYDSLLATQGFTALTESTQRLLSPLQVTDAEFATFLARIRESRLPVYACNLFIPRELKVVGPEVDEEAVMAYVEAVLQRAGAAGITLITWGSGGSRSVPEGWSYTTATAQFIDVAKRVAAVAERHGILLALENLNTTECNFITSLREALAVVRAVDHPNFRLCVDIYHMLKNGEPASDIQGVGEYAVYSELAERDGRTAPGAQGDDFRPYLRALRREDYHGHIMIEARWGELAEEGATAYRTVRSQVQEAYGE